MERVAVFCTPRDVPAVRVRGLTRRSLLRAALLVPAVSAGLPAASAAALPTTALRIRPREEWAAGLPPRGPLLPERREDVRFLLVHHTASRNDYGTADVAQELRDFYRFHTGPERGWPDIAYNFLVDRHGGVWEGRAGSAGGPVQASATGGSQGFAQLACFIGDFTTRSPTPAARASMLSLLAWLADRDDVDTAPGATASFVSRGSNRHPAGRAVTTPTISAHRDMSLTSCPGDGVYSDVRERFPAQVSALRAAADPVRSSPAAQPVATPSPPPAAASAASSAVAPTPAAARSTAAPSSPTDDGLDASSVLLGSGVLAAAAAGVVAAHRSRERRP